MPESLTNVVITERKTESHRYTRTEGNLRLEQNFHRKNKQKRDK